MTDVLDHAGLDAAKVMRAIADQVSLGPISARTPPMTTNVTRYAIGVTIDEELEADPHPEGEWVKYEDIKHLLAPDARETPGPSGFVRSFESVQIARGAAVLLSVSLEVTEDNARAIAEMFDTAVRQNGRIILRRHR